MKHRRATATLATLAALAAVVGGTLLATTPAPAPQAGTACYQVVTFYPYPRMVWYCPGGGGGGGGSW